MEAIHSSETSVPTRTTWQRIPDDDILYILTSLAEYRNEAVVPKELRTGVSAVTVPTATNKEIPW
jgi:hypothetical protein